MEMVRVDVLLRTDTTNLCSVSRDILRAHILAHKPEQLQSAKRNTLHPARGYARRQDGSGAGCWL